MSKRLIFVPWISVLLFGCSYFTNPYADFSVGKVDEESGQTPAVILVGDPQVISRETLINDRIRELDHLGDMIQRSNDLEFVPQLRRDLSVIRSMAVQLGISFNPSAGAAFERAENIESLKSEIEIVKLKNELDQLKELVKSEPGNAALKPGEEKTGDSSAVTEPSVSSIQSQLNDLITSTRKKLADLEEASGTKTARETQISASPEEHFEDLNAYRARLRQRESEVRLDDVHDANGNTLYRLQFNATILPGKIKNKYGVLDFEILPAEVSDSEIQSLYDFWLIDLMMRAISQPASVFEWERLQTVLLRQDLFERVILFDTRTRSNKKMDLILFTYPGDDETIIKMLEPGMLGAKLVNAAKNNLKKFNTLKPSERQGLRTDAKRVIQTLNSIAAIEVFLSTLKTEKKEQVMIPAQDEIDSLLDTFNKIIVAAKSINNTTEPIARSQVPDAFKAKVRTAGHLWAGEAYSYQAQPTERVQRISSLASAANSMQMAMSLAATLPVKGVGLNAGAGASRAAVGMVDALERSPIVVGYTDRSSINGQTTNGGPRFGYIFGPKAMLNAKTNTLEYRQLPASHAVYADVSVPSWWPILTLKVRRAWAGNWNEGTKVLGEGSDSSVLKVRLRPQRFGTGLLTRFLANDVLLGSLEQTKIADVIPDEVSACADRVEFLVKGQNLWRNARVYLRGKRHETLDVLPDMNGIVVSFNIQSLPAVPTSGEQDRLVVWTSYGKDEHNIRLIDSVNGEPCKNKGSAASLFLSTKMTRYIKQSGVNPKVKVYLSQPLPPAVRDVNVSLKLLDKRHVEIFEGEKAPTSVNPNEFYESDVPVDPPGNIGNSALAGASLFLGLSYKTEDFGPRHQSYARRPVVYYPGADWANFKLETASIKRFGDKVLIDLPARFEDAYPKALKQSDSFVAKINGHSKVPINAVADWVSSSGKVSLALVQGTAEQTDLDAFNKAWCEKDLTLALEISPNAGDDFPSAVEGTLKLKMRTSGCK